VKKILQESKNQVNILANLDEQVSKLRAASIFTPPDSITRRPKEYLEGNVRSTTDFRGRFRASNIDIRLYKKYPFGLYIEVGNYVWFTPLWNRGTYRGSAIRNTTLEIRSESELGRILQENFEVLWADSQEFDVQISEKNNQSGR
jgi:hypothetical protein